MRILVVDDKEENGYYLEALLKGHGHAVDVARHGAEALVLARSNPPDLIVSDLLMPVMDGYMLLRHWKGDPALKHIPFIVYTATYTEPRDEQLALDLGADAFILKPSAPDDFMAKLATVSARAVIESPKSAGSPESDPALLELYSRTLIRKLEEKTLQLDEVNRALQLDIAERIRTEAELKRIAAELRQQAQLLDKAKDAILVRDLDHKVRYWNRSAERLYGFTAEEAIGRSVVDLLYSDPSVFERANAAALALGEWAGEIEQRTKAGETITVEGHWTLVRDDDGQPTSMFVINTDISQRKAMELQFLRAQRLESIGTLAGGIAHDLNNVLAPILMSIGLLKQTLQKPENLEILNLIESSATRGADMVAQVLSFARGAGGRRVRTSVSHAARDILRIATETFPKNITVTTHIAPDLWALEADPTQLHQVLLNLCVNARDAMPQGGQITISARNVQVEAGRATTLLDARDGPYVCVEVADTGTGIPGELIDKIFDPFFTTKEVGKGTGLGLSTMMAIVKSHGGFLDCDSRLGRGTTFRVHFPAQPFATVGQPEAAPAHLPRGRGETIMVVDDELSIRQIAKHTLESFGYRVVVAANGSEAVSIYVQQQDAVHLVLMDMMMPVMDGPATIRVLRRVNPGVRIIGASGQNTAEQVTSAAGEGVTRFLPKPFSAETLLVAIRETLMEAGPSGPANGLTEPAT